MQDLKNQVSRGVKRQYQDTELKKHHIISKIEIRRQ